MKDWFERYQERMLRTRQISIVGSAVMVLFALLESYKLAHAVSLAEVDIVSDRDLLLNIAKIFLSLLLVAVAFSARMIILKKGRQYYWNSASWIVASAVGIFYIWMTEPQPPPTFDCVPDGKKICFAIYDISTRLDWVRIYALVMPVASFVRSAVTGSLAAGTSTYK